MIKFDKRSGRALLIFRKVIRIRFNLTGAMFLSSQGAFGREMSRWVTKEVKDRHFGSNGKCTMGLEVDFRGGKGCDVRRKSKNVKKRIRRLVGFSIRASIRLKLQGVVFRVPRLNYTGIPFL